MTAWEREADRWIAWIDTPGDVFGAYFAHFLEEIMPPPGRRTLEIGCGEGRVMRALAATGHAVVGVEAAPALARTARSRDPSAALLLADATVLPFRGSSIETVIVYNVLQTMAAQSDMVAAVREAARVLQPGGHLCVCVAHPMTDAGRVCLAPESNDIRLAGSYFERRRVEDTVTHGGRTMTFTGWTYTLDDYARAIESAGLLIDRLREPVPAQGDSAADLWQRVPLFLFIRARKPPPGTHDESGGAWRT